MDVIRLRADDGSYDKFKSDWALQCDEVDDDFDSYCDGSVEMVEKLAANLSEREWAIAIVDGDSFMAIACAIRANQKGLKGWTLRVREVTVCPRLDYGIIPEIAYSETLIALLNGAIKLSESCLVADNIKLHLRSPQDAMFFRSFGNTLDSKGVFAATEANGAWLTLVKRDASPLQVVK